MFYSEANGTIRNTCLPLTLTQHFLHKAELSNKPPRIYCLWRKQFLAFDGGQNENDEWLWQFDFWIWTFLTVMMLKFKCKSPSLIRERWRGEQREGSCSNFKIAPCLMRHPEPPQWSQDPESECCHLQQSVFCDPGSGSGYRTRLFVEFGGWGMMRMKVNLLSRLRRSLMSLRPGCQDPSCDHWWLGSRSHGQWSVLMVANSWHRGSEGPDIRLLAAAKHQQPSSSPLPLTARRSSNLNL